MAVVWIFDLVHPYISSLLYYLASNLVLHGSPVLCLPHSIGSRATAVIEVVCHMAFDYKALGLDPLIFLSLSGLETQASLRLSVTWPLTIAYLTQFTMALVPYYISSL